MPDRWRTCGCRWLSARRRAATPAEGPGLGPVPTKAFQVSDRLRAVAVEGDGLVAACLFLGHEAADVGVDLRGGDRVQIAVQVAPSGPGALR
jgi:hypothetical protein